MFLGVTTLVPFMLALIARRPLERLFILSADETKQVRRQFLLDLGLCLGIGLFSAYANLLVHNVPFVNGLTFWFGAGIIGFFISLDMALARERLLIQAVRKDGTRMKPPKHLYPMTRKFSLVAFASTLFCVMILFMAISRDFEWLADVGKSAGSLEMAKRSVMIEIIFIFAVLFGLITNLILSYSRNLKMLFSNETGVLEKVSRGNLKEMVPVITSDEFGYIAGHTNTMIEGLRHRSQLLTSLKLAEEVQQNLLPKKPPDIDGVDISGISLYCDRTGGDYYDFLALPKNRLGVLVADAADHGIGSALHMTTARAFFKYGVRYYDEPVQYIQQVNRYLYRDSHETGRFMTLFFLEIDPAERCLRWIRAGHDPAALFNPSDNTFSELGGKGIALGLTPDYTFKSYELEDWYPGGIVIIGTDGIREARNADGEMFGIQRLYETVRRHSDKTARQILKSVISSYQEFQQDVEQEDDVTLVVLKFD